MENFIVKKDIELMEYLIKILPKWSRKEIKQYLTHGSISVNDKIRTKYNHALKPGDTVSIASEQEACAREVLRESSIEHIYEDNDLIVVNKPHGLLTIANDTTSTETLYYKVTDYVRSAGGRNEKRVFIVHRLDEDASGLIVFAKNEKTKDILQTNWDKVEKKYYAVTEGCPKEKQGEIKSYLAEGGAFRVYSVQSTTKSPEGKLAVTQYSVINAIPGYSLLEVTLLTGRKNQIRVHLSEMGCPIVGDKKYGAKTNPARRLGLHAYCITFLHPVTKKKMTFQTELPKNMKRIFNLSN